MAKECTEPRNPDNVTCRNCDQKGHFSRDCPLPRDYSKVQCQNCQEFGHTIKVSTTVEGVTKRYRLTFRSDARLRLPRAIIWVTAVLLAMLAAGVLLRTLVLWLLVARLLGAAVVAVTEAGRQRTTGQRTIHQQGQRAIQKHDSA
jgi:hypothetical protein